MNPELLALYGPPGTGKTWRAAREAVRIIDPSFHSRWLEGAQSDEEISERHAALVAAQQIIWVTFHPSYSYEDFVEGFRPRVSSTGQVIYEIVDGPFITACNRSLGISGPAVGDTLIALGGRKTYTVRDVSPAGWLLEVRPERSDQVGEEQRKFVDRGLIDRAIKANLPPKVFSIPGKSQKTYADYGLQKPGTATGSDIRREVAEILKVSSSDLSNSSHIGALHQAILDSPSAKSDMPVVIVIDEINRADLSRVFGELITLIEGDKRLGEVEERTVYLPYSKRSFGAPPGVSIISTMNTADRSLSAMDFAMRRRFTFVEVEPNPELCPADYGGLDLCATLNGINQRLSVLRSRDQRIGHSYLMEVKLEQARNQLGFGDSDDGKIRAAAYILRNQVVPLLAEYFHEDWREIEVALGIYGEVFGSTALPLLVEIKLPEGGVPDDIGFAADSSSYMLPEWWDPNSSDFDSEAFAQAIKSMS